MALIRVSAYAKINLFLAVLGRRPDGFHDIFTVMRRTSLCDEVSVETVSDGRGVIEISVVGSTEIPTDSKNLAYRAAEKYLERSAIKDSVRIKIEKNIPIGAGLGGGSADAAATLRALERIYGALSGEEILDIAASIGSDVPFCIFGWTAVCEGRGEKITPITDKREMHLVIAMKDRSVSTPEAFRLLDIKREGDASTRDVDCEELIKYLSGEGDIPELYNDFDGVLGDVSEDVNDLKRRMSECGAASVCMSGSGPSVFGIFPDEDTAKKCVSALQVDGIRAYYSK